MSEPLPRKFRWDFVILACLTLVCGLIGWWKFGGVGFVVGALLGVPVTVLMILLFGAFLFAFLRKK